MGFLVDKGVAYDYYESLPFQLLLKQKGINQFLNLLKKFGSFNLHNQFYDYLKDPNLKEEFTQQLLWGDEFEGHVVKLYPEEQLALLQPNTGTVFQQLEHADPQEAAFIALPEFGSWMIEVTPNKPYQCMCFNFDQVLLNMRRRVNQIQSYLPPGNHYLLLPVYPMLGVGRFSTTIENDLSAALMEKVKAQTPYLDKTPNLYEDGNGHLKQIMVQPYTPLKQIEVEPIVNYFSQSMYFDDRLINPHPRYSTLAQNIRLRRGSKVEIKIPIFMDEFTNLNQTDYEPNPGFITMDHMGFGMGNCALQTTFLSIDMDHARLLYDQLAVLAPLFAALTAGSPIFKGKLADWDTKWDCLEMSVDCRNPDERNSQNPNYIPKSRYSGISYFISNDPKNLPEYNDTQFPVNQEIMDYANEKSQEMGIQLDQKLLHHLGILFIRDNMVMFKDKINLNDDEVTSHFEAIQSSNWNSVRFKPPPSYNSKIGWRVEFRTMEIQLTADENAAWSIYILKIVRLFYKKFINVNFYIPMSLVDENFRRSKLRDAISSQKFYFRTNFQDNGHPIVEELYLKEILFGKKDGTFKGIQGLLDEFRQKMMKANECGKTPTNDLLEKNRILQNEVDQYVKDRVYGKTKTLAQWMRNFVQNHPTYQKDSIVTHQINYDLIKRLIDIRDHKINDPDFPKIFTL